MRIGSTLRWTAIAATGLCLSAGVAVAQDRVASVRADRLAFLSPAAAGAPAARTAVTIAVPMPRPSPLRNKPRPLAPASAADSASQRSSETAEAPVRVAYAADPGDTVPNPFAWLMRQTLAPAPEPERLPTGELKPVPPSSIPDRTGVPQIEPRYHVRRVPIAPADLVVMIENKAIKHGVPLALAHAVIRVESNFDPRLTGRGATFGLMQIKYPTARSLGFTGTAADLLRPEENLEWGMRYLAQAHRLAKGDTCGTVMRYQGGLRSTRMSAAAIPYCSKVKVLLAAR